MFSKIFKVVCFSLLTLFIISCPGDVAVKGISIQHIPNMLKTGEAYTFSPEITPRNATDKRVVWESSNEDVLIVIEDEKISYKNNILLAQQKTGKVELTCITIDGDKKDSKVVEVYEPVNRIEIKNDLYTDEEGYLYLYLEKDNPETIQFTAYARENDRQPTYSENRDFYYESSDTKVATVSEDGEITFLSDDADAVSRITILSKYDRDASVSFFVKRAVHIESISFEKEQYQQEGGNIKIPVKIKPENATDKRMRYKSSDENVAVISDDGTIKIKSTGNSTITYTSFDGEKEASFELSVPPSPEKCITFSSNTADKIQIASNSGKGYEGGKNFDTIEYSTPQDYPIWSKWNGNAVESKGSSVADNKIYMRGIGNKKITPIPPEKDDVEPDANRWKIDCENSDAKVYCDGDIKYILDYNSDSHTINTGCFAYMFANNKQLASAPYLSIKSLSKMCYKSMFEGCTSLENLYLPPEDAKYNDGCMDKMYKGCTSIKIYTESQPGRKAFSLFGNEGDSERFYEDMFKETDGDSSILTPEASTNYYTPNSIFCGVDKQ